MFLKVRLNRYVCKKKMKKIILILTLLSLNNITISQYKEVYSDSSEIARITKVINISGTHLETSRSQHLLGYALIGIGSAISVFRVLEDQHGVKFIRGLTPFISTPYSCSCQK